MAVTVTVEHTKVATLPDEPGAEINKEQWNGTDAHTVVVSGSDTIVGITGTMAQFDTALTDGDFVYQSTAPTLTGTNISGTAAGLTAGNVTTNANLTGDVTSVGNATTLTNAAVIAKVLTGYSSGAGTVAATDTILQAFNKLNGNDGLKANLASPTFTGTVVAPAIDGSTAANGDLTLQGTSSATRTTSFVDIQRNGGTVRMGSGASGISSLGNALLLTESDYPRYLLENPGSTSGQRVLDFFLYQGKATYRSLSDNAGGTVATILVMDLVTGNVGTGGNTAPTAKIHPAAGTATASTAPLKLTAGTNLTVVENGAFEYDGTNLYFTTGGARKTITMI